MNSSRLIVWCNAHFPDHVLHEFRAGLGKHDLVLSSDLQKSNLVSGRPDPLLHDADIAFGQPDPAQVVSLPRLRWVHLTSAGYSRYDREGIRAALAARKGALTNSSAVYA